MSTFQMVHNAEQPRSNEAFVPDYIMQAQNPNYAQTALRNFGAYVHNQTPPVSNAGTLEPLPLPVMNFEREDAPSDSRETGCGCGGHQPTRNAAAPQFAPLPVPVMSFK
ncbi:hypothetical protein Pan44_02590 [Caulifigura coniformis]|uniref:Uncharacterized protein n=1 Tax=Caulifigura coniformis TaxID=2527983 RepID=A0A517S7Z9_9PLAN|nr:hypothetical protein [Caulifigura coniformis]QDT52250.1 hypothetical protein Pan44_02590 [Caulifigura coniformis]